MTPFCVSRDRRRYVAQQLVADGVVGGERGGVGGGGLRAGLAAVGLDEQHRLALRHALGFAHEGGAVAETLQIGPGLLHGGLVGVVAHDVHLIHVAGIAEGDKLGDPAVVVATGQLGS